MTLAAAILLLGISSLTALSPGVAAQSARSSAPASSASNSTQDQQTPANPSSTGTEKTGSDQTPKAEAPPTKPKSGTRKRSRPKHKAEPTDCDPAPASSTLPNSTSSGSPPTTASATPESTTSTTPKPCAPPKIVVRQGGISEQSIQLAGSSTSGDNPSQKRDAANRMLAATDENLKKIAGQQLTAAQQTSASQIRQFVKQSKSALAAGDLERAQTLAWKAKLLSDDLVNPGK